MSILKLLNEKYPVRRTEREKENFRRFVFERLRDKGIESGVIVTRDGKNANLLIGDPLKAKVVCTAHYDTPAASVFPNMMIPRNTPLFLLCQFAPVILLLAAALGGGFLIAAAVYPRDDAANFMRVFLIAYMAIYYGLYFLLYRVFKNPNNHNDNTSGVAAVLTMAESLREEQRGDVAFILFDNEEKGKKGSKAYFKDHKEEMKNRLVVNFDCVGNGDHVVFIAMKEAEQREEYQKLKDSFPGNARFRTYFYPMKGSQSNSDYKNFPCGIGCMACRETRSGVLYTPYIHTLKDTVADEENIRYIAECMSEFFAAVSAGVDFV